MYSKLNAKYLSVKQENCHFPNIHFNFSHATPIQGIIQAVLFCLLLHACQFVWQTSDTLEKESSKNLCSGKAVNQSADVKVKQDWGGCYMLR